MGHILNDFWELSFLVLKLEDSFIP